MSSTGRSAVVLGASMAGLLAARALSNHFAGVTIVERDVLPAGADLRKGVPQACHAHGLLASGYRIMDAYFPGMMDELEAAGGARDDILGRFLWFQYGRWKLRHDSGLRGIAVTRACLDAAIRRRVKALPNVTILEGVTGKPVFDTAAGRVSGLLVRGPEHGGERIVEADLVVDASGRGSQSPRWLEEWGFGRPDVLSVPIDVGYATRVYERKPGDLFDSTGMVVAGTPPAGRRMAAVLFAEAERWVVTLGGVLGDHPPADPEGWTHFAAGLPHPAVHQFVTTARPVSDITTFRFPAHQRRCYERMARFPPGYLVIGDAICSFNPLYGQGMSVAASEARALDECLAIRPRDLARDFFARAAAIVAAPWQIAVGEDMRHPEVRGHRPRGYALVNRYLERVHAVASADAEVCRRFFEVVNLLAPPSSLFSPGMLWRVLTRRVPAGAGSPWGLAGPPASPDALRSVLGGSGLGDRAAGATM